jgi:ubiquinone/menaquinone biosynthesis C-methylase UbiE
MKQNKAPAIQDSNAEYSSSSNTAQSYNQSAIKYEKRWAGYLGHTHRRFLEHIEVQPNDIMLDLSCGTGLLAKYIIERGDSFQQLVLNDIADDMQAHASKRFEERPDVSFTSFSAEAIDKPDNYFDKIFSLSAFHNYPQQKQVLAECYRVLKPGGRLFIMDWNRSGVFRLKNWLIKLMVPERIDTRSVREISAMLREQTFGLSAVDEWYYHTWKFYYVISKKV